MEALEVLAQLGGAAEWCTLSRFGVTRASLRAAIASDLVRRVRRGCFALAAADPVQVAEVAWRGHATCTTAARHRDLPVLFEDNRIHLRVPSDRSQSGRNATIPSWVTRHPVPRALSGPVGIVGVLDDSAQCVTREAQLAMVDAALHRGLLTLRELEQLRRGGRERTDWLIRHAEPRTESMLETLARVALSTARLPFTPQVMIAGVGRVDFLVAGRVIVELDGWEHHGTPRAFADDRRRDREAISQGYRVLRFTYAEVVGDPDGLVAAVRAALSAAPWPAEVTALTASSWFHQG